MNRSLPNAWKHWKHLILVRSWGNHTAVKFLLLEFSEHLVKLASAREKSNKLIQLSKHNAVTELAYLRNLFAQTRLYECYFRAIFVCYLKWKLRISRDARHIYYVKYHMQLCQHIFSICIHKMTTTLLIIIIAIEIFIVQYKHELNRIKNKLNPTLTFIKNI